MSVNPYPVSAGSKRNGASRIVASQIDSNGDRKLNVYTNLIIEAAYSTDAVPDDLARLVSEPVLYVRPRISELISLDILRQSGTRVASLHGRTAHIIRPTERVIDLIEREQPSTLIQLQRLLGALIQERRAAVARHAGKNGGAHV